MLPQLAGLLQAAGPIMGDMGVFGEGLGGLTGGGQPGETSSATSAGTFFSGSFEGKVERKTEFPTWALIGIGIVALIFVLRKT